MAERPDRRKDAAYRLFEFEHERVKAVREDPEQNCGRWTPAPPCETGSLVTGSGDQRLFERRGAFAHFVQRRHAQCLHAERDGDLANFMRAGPLDDELANLVGHGHHLDDGDAAGVAGVFAALTAPATVERHTFKT